MVGEQNHESLLGGLYRRLYDWLCGKHPRLRPWHFQWLDTAYLLRRLGGYLPTLSGRVLDVGCGDMPYRHFFRQTTGYTGIDVVAGGADIVVAPESVWPLANDSFDIVFATQVVEHVENLPHTLGEMLRVCKPGGRIVLSFPFLYNEHGGPFDFQRFTVHGAARLMPCEVEFIETQGGYGSTMVIVTLNWINDMFNLNIVTRLCKAILLPVWAPLCLIMNGLGLLLDCLDRTGKYYNNVFVVFRR